MPVADRGPLRAAARPTTRGAVVVGVTGPGRETAALRFAADCARREDAEVVIAHAFPMALPPPPPSVLLTYAEILDVAHWVVKGVAEEFEELTAGAVEFRTMAVPGPPARVLSDLGRNARVVVAQHRDTHRRGRVAVGSTVSGAAAHARCPVVSVPDGWEPGTGEVVVGVHEGGTPREAVVAALSWAEATARPLEVVHAWRLDAAYDDIITARVSADWREEQLASLDAVAEQLHRTHPTVPIRTDVRHQWPAQALVDASRSASLVVVGRHTRHGRGTGHLGAVARAVLREAGCPVMVVPLS